MSISRKFRPELGVVETPPISLVRPMISEQRDLDALVQDVLADYESVVGNCHEFYDLPDNQDVVILGPTDMTRAIQASRMLRGASIDGTEHMLRGLLDSGRTTVWLDEKLEPFERRTSERNVQLGVRFVSTERGSLSYDRDVLYSRLGGRRLSGEQRFEPFSNPSEAVLLQNVDPVDESHLIQTFMERTGRFSGQVVLGALEVVISPEAESDSLAG